MPPKRRVALFVDYENLHSALQKRTASASNPYGLAPRINFGVLADNIEQRYGPLNRGDFVVVANFAHYDPQKGGLNQLARLVNVDSFENRLERRQVQASPGKRHVVGNYADMRLAFEIGQHAALNPADLYLLLTGDKAFAAVAHILLEQGHRVLFILPELDNAAMLIKDNFEWVAFADLHAAPAPAGAPTEGGATAPADPPPPDEVAPLLEAVSTFRQTFSAPVPEAFVRAVLGARADDLLNKANGRSKIDRWRDAAGVPCVSRREERLGGKVVVLPTRPELVSRANRLWAVARIAQAGLKEASRAQWRRALSTQADLSVNQAKTVLELLFELKILREGHLHTAYLTLPQALAFMHRPLPGEAASPASQSDPTPHS